MEDAIFPNHDGPESERYLFKLNQDSDEIHRLDMQYGLLKAVYGYRDTLELPLDISKEGELNILDIATGTGAWILDVACIPEVSRRLSPTAANRINLFACDISKTKFPPGSLTDPHGISFFLQDVTQTFPEEMHGRFDLIHAGLLCLALTEQGWKSALENVYHLLRPGGTLIFMEFNVGLLPLNYSITDFKDVDINAYLQTESPVVNSCNSILVYGANLNGLVWGLCNRFPALLNSAKLDLVSVRHRHIQYGRRSNKEHFSQDPELENLFLAINGVSSFLLSQGDLEIPRGYKILSDEERRRVLEKLVWDIMQEGCLDSVAEWIARKPL